MRFGDGWFREYNCRLQGSVGTEREKRLRVIWRLESEMWRKSKREYRVRKVTLKKNNGREEDRKREKRRADERGRDGKKGNERWVWKEGEGEWENERGEIEKDYSFTAERQRESFSLKAPFCSGAVFRFESNLPCRAPYYVYLPTWIQRTGKKRLRTRYVSWAR